ncbi:MAG: hypothetical protein ACYC96_02610 [Fimbriimonadaceae bacterium]
MNFAVSLLLATFTFAPQALPTQVPQSTSAAVTLLRTYKEGDEANYVVVLGDPSQDMHLGAKVHIKTLKLLEGGKATQELTASEVSGGPSGAEAPAKVTWTFGTDGMAAANFDVQSGQVIYSILSMLSIVPGVITTGKEFKVAWTSPDKMSTITGSGSYEGTKDLDGKKVAVVKTTLTVTPSGQDAATVHNTSNFDPATGRLISAEGIVEIQGRPTPISVKSS